MSAALPHDFVPVIMLFQRIAAAFLLDWILTVFLLEYLIDEVVQALILLQIFCLTDSHIQFTRSDRSVYCSARRCKKSFVVVWTVVDFDSII